jgi:putative ATPase
MSQSPVDLFAKASHNPLKTSSHEPLASRMRPLSLDEFAGQEHILKEGALLKRVIESDRLNSIVLFGPPGTGKTTLAGIIARKTESLFESLNAVTANVSDLRKVLERSKKSFKAFGKRTILFVDEIHRFNKAQQDVLMPDIEKGNPVFIGATVHNPFFSIISPLLSRSLIFELKALSESAIAAILKRALGDEEKGLAKMKVKATDEALSFLAKTCEGDARRALNALEIGVLSTELVEGKISFTLEVAQESIQKKAVVYDGDGDAHYDTISAFIKSMRGSDPDAAIYYLAKMLYGGEDPRFISRRIVICASEDVGNADPQALVVANAAMQASDFVGMPEARIILAQATVYISCAPKSNASYMAIEKALKDVESGKVLEVPDHLKDTHYAGSKKLGHGKDYKYAHSYEGHYVSQEYLVEKKRYYEPTEQGFEKTFKFYLANLRQHVK